MSRPIFVNPTLGMWIAPAFILSMALLSSATAAAQTADAEPTPYDGICDELIGATPGLYGLCVAYCEAQDCEPDFSLEDPLANCTPASYRILEQYENRMSADDPGMPCVLGPCPCWTVEELFAALNVEGIQQTYCLNENYQFFDGREPALHRQVRYFSDYENLQMKASTDNGQFYCEWLHSCHSGGSCPPQARSYFISVESYAACKQQITEFGIELGVECFE